MTGIVELKPIGGGVQDQGVRKVRNKSWNSKHMTYVKPASTVSVVVYEVCLGKTNQQVLQVLISRPLTSRSSCPPSAPPSVIFVIVFSFSFCLRDPTEAHHDVTSGLMSKNSVPTELPIGRASHLNQC